MIETPLELTRELRVLGLVADGADPALANLAPGRPWYIGLMLGIAGWVAGVFVLIFAFMLFKLDSGGGAAISGAVLLAAAWGLFAVDRDGAFVSQLALALSIAGQFAVLFGLGEVFLKGAHEIAGVALVALVLQAILVAAMPNALHRTMSALFACTAWALLVRYGLWDQSPWGTRSAANAELPFGLALAGWAIAWLPIGGMLYVIVRREAEWMARGLQAIVRPAAAGIILGLAVTTLLSQPFESFPWMSETAAGRGGFALWPLLSALAALGALVAAYALGDRGLTAVCVIAALVHVSHFYYAMGATLLAKSATMIVLGALLLYGAHRLKGKAP